MSRNTGGIITAALFTGIGVWAIVAGFKSRRYNQKLYGNSFRAAAGVVSAGCFAISGYVLHLLDL